MSTPEARDDNQELTRAIAEEIGSALDRTDSAQTVALIEEIIAARRVFVAGVGRSGLMAQAFAMRLVHVGLEAHVVGEVTTPAIHEGDLLVASSGSGQTRTTEAIIEAAAGRGARIVVITAHPDAPVNRLAHAIVQLQTPITTEGESIQPPGSLFEQALLVYCDAVIMQLMKRLGTTVAEMRARHTKLE
jgi:6-phospho-3-hexuloisomerase